MKSHSPPVVFFIVGALMLLLSAYETIRAIAWIVHDYTDLKGSAILLLSSLYGLSGRLLVEAGVKERRTEEEG